MRRWIPSAPLLALLLAGCGGGGGEGGGGGGGPTPVATATPTPTAAERIATLERAGTLPALNRAAGMIPNDVNANGVRDDIDAYIAATSYPAAGKQALTQLARGIQASLSVDVANATAVNTTALAATRALNCVFLRANGETDPLTNEVSRLESLTTNTRERLTAYLRYNKALDGSVSAAPVGDTCE